MIAKKRGVSSDTLVNLWIREKVQEQHSRYARIGAYLPTVLRAYLITEESHESTGANRGAAQPPPSPSSSSLVSPIRPRSSARAAACSAGSRRPAAAALHASRAASPEISPSS